jgi:hypothetical protein
LAIKCNNSTIASFGQSSMGVNGDVTITGNITVTGNVSTTGSFKQNGMVRSVGTLNGYSSGGGGSGSSGGGFGSDDRLKLNEKVITDANISLSKLRPQVYDKLTELDGNVEDAMFESGLIAQEIWYDCPELRHLVHVGEGGSPAEAIATSDDPTVDPDYSSWGPSAASVNYVGFIPYLIRGFQEHSAENTALKKENETMKAQIAMLMKASGLVDSGNVDSDSV